MATRCTTSFIMALMLLLLVSTTLTIQDQEFETHETKPISDGNKQSLPFSSTQEQQQQQKLKLVGKKKKVTPSPATFDPTAPSLTKALLLDDDVDPQIEGVAVPSSIDVKRKTGSTTRTTANTRKKYRMIPPLPLSPTTVTITSNDENTEEAYQGEGDQLQIGDTTSDDGSKEEEDDDDDDETPMDIGPEWITEAELRRRISIVDSQLQETNKYRAAQKALLDSMRPQAAVDSGMTTTSSTTHGRNTAHAQRSLQDDVVIATPTPGPVYPIHPDDVEIAIGANGIPVSFAEITPNRSKISRPVIPLVAESTCQDPDDVSVRCPAQLSNCLGIDAESRGSACGCFFANGRCFRETGCIELLPKETIKFCFSRFMCSMDECEGNGATTRSTRRRSGITIKSISTIIMRTLGAVNTKILASVSQSFFLIFSTRLPPALPSSSLDSSPFLIDATRNVQKVELQGRERRGDSDSCGWLLVGVVVLATATKSWT